MNKLMTANEFINRAVQAADSPTVYTTGGIGFALNYPGNMDYVLSTYNNKKREELIRQRAADAAAAGTECWAFDCVGLVKSILWGWTGDASKSLGGAEYGANGVPDATVDAIYDMCEHSEDFDTIVPGEYLMAGDGGHAGIYIGNGYAVEATSAWNRMVSVSGVENLSGKYPDILAYAKRRSWQGHGKLPWIQYETEADILKINGKIICPCCGREINAAVELTLSAPQDDILTEYKVQTGDSPWSIAVKFYNDGTKWEKIMEYNGLSKNAYIYTGDVLKIPRL